MEFCKDKEALVDTLSRVFDAWEYADSLNELDKKIPKLTPVIAILTTDIIDNLALIENFIYLFLVNILSIIM